MNIHLTGFQQLLYTVFTFEKKYPIDDICRLMNIDKGRFYAYTEGHTYFPPDLIRVLYNATVRFDQLHSRKPEGETRFIDFILQDTGLAACHVECRPDTDPIYKDLLDSYQLLTDLRNDLTAALEDGVVTDAEHERISFRIADLVREVQGIKAKTKPGGTKK